MGVSFYQPFSRWMAPISLDGTHSSPTACGHANFAANFLQLRANLAQVLGWEAPCANTCGIAGSPSVMEREE